MTAPAWVPNTTVAPLSPRSDDNPLAWAPSFIYVTKYYYPPVIIVAGLIGNVLMYLLMSQREFKHSSSSLYMKCLSVTDSLYLVSRTLQRFLFLTVPSILHGGAREPICLEYFIVLYFSHSASLLLLVAMTCDRAFAILFPLRSLAFSPMKRARIVSALAISVSFVYSFCLNYSRSYVPELDGRWTCPY